MAKARDGPMSTAHYSSIQSLKTPFSIINFEWIITFVMIDFTESLTQLDKIVPPQN